LRRLFIFRSFLKPPVGIPSHCTGGAERDKVGWKKLARRIDNHEGTKTMEPIDHPPGHEIERLNREIEEQYGDAEWTPASGTKDMLSALPGAESCACLWSRLRDSDSGSPRNQFGLRVGGVIQQDAACDR
jgi:hypothetical protein